MGTEEATHPQENHQEFTSLIPKTSCALRRTTQYETEGEMGAFTFSLAVLEEIYTRSSPQSVDPVSVHDIFIEGISASETGHLHDFGNRVVLGRIEFFGACQISWFYFLNRFWSAVASTACACCI